MSLAKKENFHFFCKVAIQFSLEAENDLQARKVLPVSRPLLHRRRQRRLHRRDDQAVRRRRGRQKRSVGPRFESRPRSVIRPDGSRVRVGSVDQEPEIQPAEAAGERREVLDHRRRVQQVQGGRHGRRNDGELDWASNWGLSFCVLAN